jgi:hypothetical protein
LVHVVHECGLKVLSTDGDSFASDFRHVAIEDGILIFWIVLTATWLFLLNSLLDGSLFARTGWGGRRKSRACRASLSRSSAARSRWTTRCGASNSSVNFLAAEEVRLRGCLMSRGLWLGSGFSSLSLSLRLLLLLLFLALLG